MLNRLEQILAVAITGLGLGGAAVPIAAAQSLMSGTAGPIRSETQVEQVRDPANPNVVQATEWVWLEYEVAYRLRPTDWTEIEFDSTCENHCQHDAPVASHDQCTLSCDYPEANHSRKSLQGRFEAFASEMRRAETEARRMASSLGAPSRSWVDSAVSNALQQARALAARRVMTEGKHWNLGPCSKQNAHFSRRRYHFEITGRFTRHVRRRERGVDSERREPAGTHSATVAHVYVAQEGPIYVDPPEVDCRCSMYEQRVTPPPARMPTFSGLGLTEEEKEYWRRYWEEYGQFPPGGLRRPQGYLPPTRAPGGPVGPAMFVGDPRSGISIERPVIDSGPIDPRPQLVAIRGLMTALKAVADHRQAAPSLRHALFAWLRATWRASSLSGLPPAFGTTARDASAAGADEAGRAGRAQEAAGSAVMLSLVATGASTGEVFELQIVNGSGRAVSVASPDGLVLQAIRPGVAKPVAARTTAPVQRHKVVGHCVEFAKEPPAPGTLYQVAGGAVQEKFKPVQRILEVTRRLEQAGLVTPDIGLNEYMSFLEQWAIWTKLENWDRKKFEEMFVERTKKNLAQAKKQWTKEIEQFVRASVPKRWSDVTAVLKEAGG